MSNRIIKIQKQFGSQIENIVRQQTKIPELSSEAIWNIFIESDHTSNNKNLRWIAETFLNKGFLWEDIKDGKNSKVFDTLKLFDRLKKNLPDNERNLLHYHTLGSLSKAVVPYIVKSKAEERQEEKQKAYTESKIFLDQNGLKIISPQTQYAAKWWGRGTKWCTSAEKNNMFDEYNEHGPLLIIITPEGRKFQAWKPVTNNDQYNDADIQFMDEYDDVISDFDLNENWKYINSICYYLNNQSYFPENLLTKEIKLKICQENCHAFDINDEDMMDDEFIYTLAKNNSFVSYLFSYEADDCSDYTESKDFIKHCIDSNISNIYNIFNISQEMNDFIINYVKDNYEVKDFYKFLFNQYKTQEMSDTIMKTCPDLFRYVPESHQNLQMIADNEEYFKENPHDMHYIKSEFLNKEQIIYLLTKTNSLYDKTINPDIVDDELADIISINGFHIFQQMPEQYKTYERYTNLAHKYGASIRFFPEDIIDDKMAKIAIKSDYNAFEALPKRLQTDDNKNLAQIYNPRFPLSLIDFDMTSQERFDIMIHHSPSKIVAIPTKNQTEDLWRFVANYNISTLKKLPERYKTIEFIRSLDYTQPKILKYALPIIPIPYDDLKDIIKTNGIHIKDVPANLQTKELCDIAIASNPLSIFCIDNVSEDEINNSINQILKSDPMLFFELPETYKTVENFHKIEKNFDVINHIINYDLQYLKNELTLKEKEAHEIISYNIQETYNNIQECIHQSHSKENELNPNWEKEKKERYVRISSIHKNDL